MEEPEGYPIDSEDVREQIDQQRTLAAQLREKLEQDELQLASKEQQNELLKSKLSLLKSRSKAKRSLTPNDKDDRKTKDQSASPKHPGKKQTTNSANKGKINILREQLEQNRLRFERHGLELSEDTRSMEAMVEQLRHELEERDVTIQQLQVGQEPLQSFHTEDQISEPVDLSTQLLQKEQEVKNLSIQVSDLQNVILELQENLKEKDCVIEARTQAISLLSEDMSKKWRANVDMLEETRQQMQMMQENFIRIEAGLNNEIEHLNLQLQNNAQKLTQAEQTVKTVETVRDDLASQNAELLSELKKLQDTPKTRPGLEEANLKIEELSQALSEANKLTVKLKAEHKAKVKTLNKQIDSLRKESDLSGEFVQLQNHIAELEEEKGNLQLLLLEVEESTASQEQKIEELQTTVSELQNQKLTTEKKLFELEEIQSSSINMEQEIHNLKLKLDDRENELQNLKERLSSDASSSKTELLSDLEKKFKETESALKEWQYRSEELEKQLEEKNNQLASFSSESSRIFENQSTHHEAENQKLGTQLKEELIVKVDLLEKSLQDKQMQVQELQTIVQNSLKKIESFSSQVNCLNCDILNQRLSEKEAQVLALESSVNALQEEKVKMESKLVEQENLAAEAQISHSSHFENTADKSNLQRALIEASGELELKREECSRLESKLKAQLEKAKKIAVNLKVKTVANKELEERVARYETMIQSSKAEMEEISRQKKELEEKWQMESSEKDARLMEAAEKLSAKEIEVHNLEQVLSSKISNIADLEAKLRTLEVHADQQAEDARLAGLMTELASIQNQLASEIEEKKTALNFTKLAKVKLAKEKKLRSDMLEKQKELEEQVAEKSIALNEVQDQHTKAMDYFQQEKERVAVLLKEHEDQVAVLHQQLEHERNKLQYANENMSSGEAIEVTEDLQTVPSLERFQIEVEDLCSSFSATSPEDTLPVLEEEKAKTMNELSCSFESLHNQIVKRLQNRPDLHGDRKLFAELQNLVTRVVYRTTALENKIKEIVSESSLVIQKKLLDAERSIQNLESALSETRAHLDGKEGEKLKLEDAVNNLNKDRCDLMEQVQYESQKSLSLEMKLKETYDQMDALIQSSNSLQEQINDKEIIIHDLQARYESTLKHCEQVQQELQNALQQNNTLQINFDKLHEDCDLLKSKLLTAEGDVNNTKLTCTELQNSYDKATKSFETLQQQMNESAHNNSEIQIQLQKSLQETADLQQQLANSACSISQLQQELSVKSDTYLQQGNSWTYEKEEYEKKIRELAQELENAQKQAFNTESVIPVSSSGSTEEDSLRQQLAEKTAEVENYQRRLIQLQMGAPDSAAAAPFFKFPDDGGQASETFLVQKTSANLEAAFQSESNASHPLPMLDAFIPAASFFESSSAEVSDLRIKLQSVTDQLESLLLEKKTLEVDKLNLQSTFDILNEELSTAKRELEASYPTIEELQLKVSELTSALEASESCIEKEKINANKLQNVLKDLQSKLENEKYDKEKVESELKIRAQSEADERPSIPQTLDTHVSSLQDSGSGFNKDKKDDSPDVDETVMESNITQLESELRGMVMSQQENALKKKTMEDCWEETGNKKGTKNDDRVTVKEKDEKISTIESEENTVSLLSEVNELRDKLKQLEEEKTRALAQIDALKMEINTLSKSTTQTVSTNNETVLSITDSLMNDDDSWGWGADSAHLEVQHQQQKNLNKPVPDDFTNDLQAKIEALKLENETLEKDKLQLSEDLKTSQIRAAKLTRKLRDLKAKYDDISGKSRSTESPFDSLDQAIEEERMKQMQGLEKELKDLQAEFNAVKTERDRLQKQVEVFSSANDRMLEVKERQDVEVEMWQKRSKDLTNQVQALEWRVRELEEGKEEKPVNSTEISENSHLSPKASQSPETLNPVEIDQLLKENHTWNTNYENLMQEYQKLRAQCLADSEQRTQIDALVAQQQGIIERLEHEKTYFQDVYDSLKMDYESACAQLASKQTGQDGETELLKKRVEELEEKLNITEQRMQEAVAEVEAVSSDNAEFQVQCNQLNDARKDLLLQLEESQSRLEVNAQEIIRLQQNIKTLEEKSAQGSDYADSTSQPAPVLDVFVAQESVVQGSSPNSTVLNWGNIVPSGGQQSADIFESIASNSSQVLEDQLLRKDAEMEKDKRMIETLKRTMQESEQEWGQLIEYHKNQLESAKTTISSLQVQLESLKQQTSARDETQTLELEHKNQSEKCQELQNIIFSKEKEIENLQINLAVSEESKRKLEEELHRKEAELERLLKEATPASSGISSQPGKHPASSEQTNSMSSTSVPAMTSSDKNLSNELDRALYMLHERDVRCEELTLELTQLLEERDGLQLRLSNAIRTNEELRERLKQLFTSQPYDASVHSTAHSQGLDNETSATNRENINMTPPSNYVQSVGPEASSVNLQNKLTELRSLGYSHDKRLKDDSEYRHQQQMRLMSPSPTSMLSVNSNELNISSEIASSPVADSASTISNTDPDNADQSSSNASQGSLLGWFWGSN